MQLCYFYLAKCIISIQTLYSFEDKTFHQCPVITKSIHDFCHNLIASSTGDHCKAKNVVSDFANQRKIMSRLFSHNFFVFQVDSSGRKHFCLHCTTYEISRMLINLGHIYKSILELLQFVCYNLGRINLPRRSDSNGQLLST